MWKEKQSNVRIFYKESFEGMLKNKSFWICKSCLKNPELLISIPVIPVSQA